MPETSTATGMICRARRSRCWSMWRCYPLRDVDRLHPVQSSCHFCHFVCTILFLFVTNRNPWAFRLCRKCSTALRQCSCRCSRRAGKGGMAAHRVLSRSAEGGESLNFLPRTVGAINKLGVGCWMFIGLCRHGNMTWKKILNLDP